MARQLNSFAGEIDRPITLPVFRLPPVLDDADERKELAAKLAEQRTIRRGRDAWQLVGKAESFENWKLIGAALAIGKQHALRATGANDTSSRHYIKCFSRWLVDNGFGIIKPQTRSWAIALFENAEAVTRFRDSLPERQRKRLVNPQSVVKRWQATQQVNGYHGPQDWRCAAVAAWKKFLSSVSMLPPDQAALLWQTVRAAANAAA
jgi:hypothetical protein